MLYNLCTSKSLARKVHARAHTHTPANAVCWSWKSWAGSLVAKSPAQSLCCIQSRMSAKHKATTSGRASQGKCKGDSKMCKSNPQGLQLNPFTCSQLESPLIFSLGALYALFLRSSLRNTCLQIKAFVLKVTFTTFLCPGGCSCPY